MSKQNEMSLSKIMKFSSPLSKTDQSSYGVAPETQWFMFVPIQNQNM